MEWKTLTLDVARGKFVSLAEAEARLNKAKARATAFFDEGIKRADRIRDLEARLAAAQTLNRKNVEDCSSCPHIAHIKELETRLRAVLIVVDQMERGRS